LVHKLPTVCNQPTNQLTNPPLINPYIYPKHARKSIVSDQKTQGGVDWLVGSHCDKSIFDLFFICIFLFCLFPSVSVLRLGCGWSATPCPVLSCPAGECGRRLGQPAPHVVCWSVPPYLPDLPACLLAYLPPFLYRRLYSTSVVRQGKAR